MNTNNQEIEAKFLISNLPALLVKLKQLGAVEIRPRVLETNLRFDTPEGRLSQSAQCCALGRTTRQS